MIASLSNELVLGLFDVSFRYSNDKRYAANDITFTLEQGKTLALLGESGSGKSTIAKLSAGLLQPQAGRIIKPEQGQTQVIFQSSSLSLSPHYKVSELIAEGLIIQGQSKQQYMPQVIECMEKVGLPVSLADYYASQLSGGQRQRVNIARAIIMKPKLLIADEPISALDVSVQAQVANILKPLVKELNCTLLLIIHDLLLANYLADDIVVLKQGKIVEQGSVQKVFNQPQHTYTKALLAAY